jgi:inosose dehydratase
MANIRWGYAINQWRNTEVDLVTREQRESAFKVLSVSGFSAAEITDNAIGGPDLVPAYFGSVHGFKDFINSCGVDRVCSYFGNLGGGSPANPTDHARLAEAAKRFAGFLAELGGSCLIVRAMGSYWREAPITQEKLKIVANCWNGVGKATRAEGIQVALHVDFLCGVRKEADLDQLMKVSDPAAVGLALDTAELVIAGVDPVKFYEKNYARIKHFHFKDATVADTLDEYKEPNADVQLLNVGGKRQIDRWFYEMGTPGGLVNFPMLFKSMKQHDYDGWVVAESDQSPHVEESVMLNGWYVKQVLARL